ncbi:MAG TPA: hypothetical protein VND22_08215 [Actinomycetota bacterium]|nr:hypothetical protein [Actinomycetota bacterium]
MLESPFYNGCAIVDRSDIEKLNLTGPQNAWFLNQLLTSDVERMASGEWGESLLLTPKGRISAYLQLINLEDRILVASRRAPDQEPLAAFLQSRVFTTEVEIEDVTGRFSLLTLLGPRSSEICALVSGAAPGQGQAVASGEFVVTGITQPIPGFDLWVPSSSFDEVVAQMTDAGAVTVTEEQFREVCAESGFALFGFDFDETFLPQEAALERAVAFDKGCYLGQEAVAMAQRGRVKRKLRHLEFRGKALVGEVVQEDGNSAGSVTSVGASATDGFGIGRISTAVEVGSTVSIRTDDATSSALVRELPGASAGPERPSARELRERLGGRA